MPIDLEMLMSTSNHSFFPYSSYNATNYTDDSYDHRLSFRQNHCVPKPPVKHQDLFRRRSLNGGFASGTSYNSKGKSAARQNLYSAPKKKVSFADDKGFKLVEVREIPENAPKWADDVITLLIGSTRRSVVKERKWKVAFVHPPWHDEKLIETLEKNRVALEHVSVKEGTEDLLIGTVKVKNLAFKKTVFIRVTFDRWLSYVDIPCTYMAPNQKPTKPSTYDTFSFETKILPVASRYEVIEFCVCFQCNGKEYWDNNCGINYRLIVEYVRSNVPEIQALMPTTYSELEDIRNTEEISV